MEHPEFTHIHSEIERSHAATSKHRDQIEGQRSEHSTRKPLISTALNFTRFRVASRQPQHTTASCASSWSQQIAAATVDTLVASLHA